MAEMWTNDKWGHDHHCGAIPDNACEALGQLADALRSKAKCVRGPKT